MVFVKSDKQSLALGFAIAGICYLLCGCGDGELMPPEFKKIQEDAAESQPAIDGVAVDDGQTIFTVKVWGDTGLGYTVNLMADENQTNEEWFNGTGNAASNTQSYAVTATKSLTHAYVRRNGTPGGVVYVKLEKDGVQIDLGTITQADQSYEFAVQNL